MKKIEFLGDSLSVIRGWPDEVKKITGHQLNRIQKGLNPENFKPFKTVGAGVQELRVKFGDEYRVIYTVKSVDAIYLLHAFVKKTQKTPKRIIDLAIRRLKEIV